ALSWILPPFFILQQSQALAQTPPLLSPTPQMTPRLRRGCGWGTLASLPAPGRWSKASSLGFPPPCTRQHPARDLVLVQGVGSPHKTAQRLRKGNGWGTPICTNLPDALHLPIKPPLIRWVS
uniref:Uncharacterized protein n=1 Tax=Crocodylus porosus TaxID=8502 RepID=A0A7M4ER75_CROPO